MTGQGGSSKMHKKGEFGYLGGVVNNNERFGRTMKVSKSLGL
jgi:hypothetical protein